MTDTKHPAKYSDSLLPILYIALAGYDKILDPFAGTGKLKLIRPDAVLVEIEPEWAYMGGAVIANTLQLPFDSGQFDAICTSPCLVHGHRILRSDLRWIECENIRIGDDLIAFDEYGIGVKSNGAPRRRCWRHARVTSSYELDTECVGISLSNGDYIECTPDHKWLAYRYKSGGNSQYGGMQWIKSSDIVNWHVLKQLDTWRDGKSYEFGWLSGMSEADGHMSYTQHGAPKLVITQRDGDTQDKILEMLEHCGYEYSVIPRKKLYGNAKPISNIYITGGFPAILKFLGEVRPDRLMQKLDILSERNRCIQSQDRVRVEKVEKVGKKTVQVIETSTGTYIGDGYLMHNCYGNRMADSFTDHQPQKRYRRNTYTHSLGRKLHVDNSGHMQWGAKYRRFHVSAWQECARVLRSGGRFVLNISDHIRDKKIQPVSQWHIDTLESLGLGKIMMMNIETPRNRMGQNRNARVKYEHIVILVKE